MAENQKSLFRSLAVATDGYLKGRIALEEAKSKEEKELREYELQRYHYQVQSMTREYQNTRLMQQAEMNAQRDERDHVLQLAELDAKANTKPKNDIFTDGNLDVWLFNRTTGDVTQVLKPDGTPLKGRKDVGLGQPPGYSNPSAKDARTSPMPQTTTNNDQPQAETTASRDITDEGQYQTYLSQTLQRGEQPEASTPEAVAPEVVTPGAVTPGAVAPTAGSDTQSLPPLKTKADFDESDHVLVAQWKEAFGESTEEGWVLSDEELLPLAAALNELSPESKLWQNMFSRTPDGKAKFPGQSSEQSKIRLTRFSDSGGVKMGPNIFLSDSAQPVLWESPEQALYALRTFNEYKDRKTVNGGTWAFNLVGQQANLGKADNPTFVATLAIPVEVPPTGTQKKQSAALITKKWQYQTLAYLNSGMREMGLAVANKQADWLPSLTRKLEQNIASPDGGSRLSQLGLLGIKALASDEARGAAYDQLRRVWSSTWLRMQSGKKILGSEWYFDIAPLFPEIFDSEDIVAMKEDIRHVMMLNLGKQISATHEKTHGESDPHFNPERWLGPRTARGEAFNWMTDFLGGTLFGGKISADDFALFRNQGQQGRQARGVWFGLMLKKDDNGTLMRPNVFGRFTGELTVDALENFYQAYNKAEGEYNRLFFKGGIPQVIAHDETGAEVTAPRWNAPGTVPGMFPPDTEGGTGGQESGGTGGEQ